MKVSDGVRRTLPRRPRPHRWLCAILLLSTLKLQGCFGTPDPWTYSITPTGETLIATTPVIYLQQVHFGTDDGRFVALHQQNGTEQWIHKTGGRIRSSPTVFENILYFGSDDGYLYALNARGGKEMWRFQANGSVSSTPTVNDRLNRLFFGADNGVMYGLHIQAGQLEWSYQTGGPISSSVAMSQNIRQDQIYFGSDDGFVYALRESDGLLMWRFDTSGPVRTTAAVDHDLVLVGSGSGKFYGIQERGGVEVWHFDAKAAIYTSAAVHRGFVFFGCDNGMMYALQETTGEKVWEYNSFSQIRSSIAPAIDAGLRTRNPLCPERFDRRKGLGIHLGRAHPSGRRVEAIKLSAKDLLVSLLMEGKSTDWTIARRCAEQIRSPSYTTKDFHEDITRAFPELRLYCLEIDEEEDMNRSANPSRSISTGTCAGRSAFDEYQRTIGAMFCIFWLMRLHLDGKECFCFGLNNDWQPKTEADFQQTSSGHSSRELQVEFRKRQAFYENANWEGLEKLFVGAGLLKKPGGPHDPDRTLAMLVLMTIHDLMKLDRLRPTVTGKSFNGYRKNEQIGDHDIALSYVLERYQGALPSFAGLSKSQQDSIRFTHCKMDYNMGWLVQAEAPPGMLFGALRKAIREGMQSARKSQDVAFYFVHWFADLAGAEPFPMQGCEKFVLKFPLPVLTNFIESFPVVWDLGPKTETQVYEDYLEWRWARDGVGIAMPPDACAVAKMRLVVMSQGNAQEILRAFGDLPLRDQETLAEELALTGCQDQAFSLHPQKPKGPAILVYYGPALMQKAGAADPYNTMRILAEIYRTARQHWPITEGLACAGMTTILRIDALKELTAQEIFENQSQGRLQYVIVRNGGKDGQVKSYPPASGKPQELEGSVPLEIEGLKEAVWRHSPYSWGSIPGSFYKAASMKTKSLPGYATAFSKPFMAFVK